METLENSERHWPARRKHMFFQIFMAQHICRDAVEIRKRLVRTVLIFTESSDQLSRATDRVPGLPASPGYVQ